MFRVLLYVTFGELMIHNFKEQPVDRGTTPLLVYQTLKKEFSSCGNNIATCSGKTIICTFPLVRFVKVTVDILHHVHFALPRRMKERCRA